MASISLSRAIRHLGVVVEHDANERAEQRPSLYDRVKEWAETYATYKIEQTNLRRFDV